MESRPQVDKVTTKKDTSQKPQANRIVSPPKLRIVNAQTIIQTQYSGPVFVIEKILHVGATILASRPKFGKTWLALQIAIAVATGRKALKSYNVIRSGRVLYLALEETERRIQDRINVLLPQGADISRLDVLFELPQKLGEGGEVYVSQHLRQHPGEYALVIIDTLFSAFAGSLRRDIVKVDYEKSELLRKLAHEHNVALLLVHHQNKGKDQSAVDSINGTTGVTASIPCWYWRKRTAIS
jgi:RecA-family ATPase